MPSDKQIAANRRNAQRSTGPQAPEGKAAVRFNALKHGLTAEHAVTFVEDEEAFRENADTHATFGRYEARIERAFFRALYELQRLPAARKANSAEQSQSAPETQPNPLPQNDLSPSARVAQDIRGELLNLPAPPSDRPIRVPVTDPLAPASGSAGILRKEPECRRI